MLEKNKCYDAEVTDITSEGNGVCRVENMAVFVPCTAVGDKISVKIVKVLKNYSFGIVDKIIEPSQNRIDSGCKFSQKCGGCIFQHISYEAECRVKSEMVQNAIKRIGGVEPNFEGIVPCNTFERYRNKAQYPLADINGKVTCGFYAQRSHRLIPITDCILQPKIFSEILNTIIDYLNEKKISAYNESSGTGLMRHIYIREGTHSKEIMVCFVARRDVSRQLSALCHILTDKFPTIKSLILNINPDNTNVILGKKCVTLWGEDTITDTMCENTIEISPLSFYQVNTLQAEKLYAKALEYAQPTPNDVISDLYCGAGTIGLSMANNVKKLIGIEIIPQAVENARKNASCNNIHNAEFFCGDAGTVFSDLKNSDCSPNIIIVDPPRKGCSVETLISVASAAPEKIVMISCNPSTAARDIKWLCNNSFILSKCCAFDLFPRTGHVETVVLLSREKVDGYVSVDLDVEKIVSKSGTGFATYKELKTYIKEQNGLSVSSLNIAQIKDKCGLEKRKNYYKGDEGHKVPNCPAKKEKAILEAFKHFGII